MSDGANLSEQLASKNRRRVLVLLRESDALRIPEDVICRGAVRSVTARNEEPHPGQSAVRQLELRLRHTDVPKLEAAGLVDSDREARTVSRGPNFERVEPAVGLLVDNPQAFPVDLI
jgi:hypothetical protein